eukprot:802023-Alexandrium_andersonii.AAC.1
MVAQPARGERQSDLQSRGAPRAALGERQGADRICVKHAFEREVALLPSPHALLGPKNAWRNAD